MRTLKETCQYCHNPIRNNEMYLIYRLLVATNVQVYFIGLQKLIEELNDYCMQHAYHLSASQIILLRPDILKAFLTEKYYPEKPVFHILCESEICYNCYISYKDLIPER